MSIVKELRERLGGVDAPVLVHGRRALRFRDLAAAESVDLTSVRAGDVVALIGGFEALTLGLVLRLFDLGAIVAPLVEETRPQHPALFASAHVQVVVDGGQVTRLASRRSHHLLDALRSTRHPGLVFFTSGSTGPPKAILHDLETFLVRYRTPRPALRSITFLNFDHIGGLNTLLHTLFNGGTLIVPSARDACSVLHDAAAHQAELLPTTPTFLRMLLLLEGALPLPSSLRVITYGTESMDQHTLDRLCERYPSVDFRQTYGMSEIGILRVRSKARNSLWMSIGGEGVETRCVAIDGGGSLLHLRSRHAMMGYLNAPSPFDSEGWYDTRDLVRVEGEWWRILGRADRVINVAGVKASPEEIEAVGLAHLQMIRCRAEGKANPITGQHIEVACELAPDATVTSSELRRHFRERLPERLWPARVRIEHVSVSHRFKQA